MLPVCIIFYDCISVCSMPNAAVGTALTINFVFWPVNFFFRLFWGGYLPGKYPYPGLLWFLYNPIRYWNICEFCTAFIPVPELSISVLSVGCTRNHTRGIYRGYFPTKNLCNFCRTLIPVPGTSGTSVRRCHKTRGTGTACLYLPETSGCSVSLCHNTRKFWKFCKTFILVLWNFWKFCTTYIPAPGTSRCYVRPWPQYPGYGYNMICTRPELREVLYACATIPGTSGSYVPLPYPYPKLLEVLWYLHTPTRKTQTLKTRSSWNILSKLIIICRLCVILRPRVLIVVALINNIDRSATPFNVWNMAQLHRSSSKICLGHLKI